MATLSVRRALTFHVSQQQDKLELNFVSRGGEKLKVQVTKRFFCVKFSM